MNIRISQRVILGLFGLFVTAFGISAVASAQSTELSSEMLDTIRSRCSNSQFALQQIEKRDAVSRINRGRAYDQMMRQLSALNSRFAYNKISSPDLIQTTNDLQKSVDAFRAHYDRYDTDITNALKVDCREKPADYYTVIVRAREDRNAVGEEVRKIDELLKSYREAVQKYEEGVR